MLNKNIKNVDDNYPAWLWASLEVWFWEPGYLSVSSLTTIASRQLTHPSVFKNIWNKTQFGLGGRQQQSTGSSDIIHRLLTFASCCDLLSSVMFPLYRAMVQQRIVVNIISINCTLLIMDLNLLKTERKTDFHFFSTRSWWMLCLDEKFIKRILFGCYWVSVVLTLDHWDDVLISLCLGASLWSSHLVWVLRPLERVKGPGNYFIQ